MLLKIITNRNTIKIIDGIEDCEILGPSMGLSGPTQVTCHEGMLKAGHHPRHNCASIEAIETYDSFGGSSAGGTESSESYTPKFVDYKKNGKLHRLAVADYAYLCNDDGKTIAKIE